MALSRSMTVQILQSLRNQYKCRTYYCLLECFSMCAGLEIEVESAQNSITRITFYSEDTERWIQFEFSTKIMISYNEKRGICYQRRLNSFMDFNTIFKLLNALTIKN